MLLAFGESIANNTIITNGIRDSGDPDQAVEELLNELSETRADSGDGG